MQTSYNFNPPVGRAGMIAEAREANVVISKLAQGLVTPGILCVPGTDPEVGMLPTTASNQSTNPGQIKNPAAHAFDGGVLGSQYVGIPIYESSRPPYSTATNATLLPATYEGYADKDYVPTLRHGVIWVAAYETIAQFGDVYVWNNPNAGEPMVGSFAAGAHSGRAVLMANARFMSADNNGVVILEVW